MSSVRHCSCIKQDSKIERHCLNMADLRKLKEDFVTGHSGTTSWEVLSFALIMPLFSLPACRILRLFSSLQRINYWPRIFSLEYVLVIVPMMAACTDLISTHVMFTIGLCATALCLSFPQQNEGQPDQLALLAKMSKPHRIYLDLYRGVLMATTCFAILAIDFHVTPRRFAKAETYGTGVMDCGPGFFVFASGIVTKATSKDRSSTSKTSYRSRVIQTFRGTVPMLVIGFLRLWATNATNYQVHVGEYGVHWNFFFTLAGVALLTSLIKVDASGYGLYAVASTVVHQMVLSLGGFSEYINSDKRTQNIFSLNKEGIFSLPGYWSLHLWGAFFGRVLLLSAQHSLTNINKKPKGSFQSTSSHPPLLLWIFKAFLCALSMYLSFVVCNEKLEMVSRRACNATYILWVSACSLFVIFVCIIVEVGSGGGPHAFRMISRNMLGVFMLANLMTGGVNLLMNTLDVKDWNARIILGAYMFLLCTFTHFADHYGVQLKL